MLPVSHEAVRKWVKGLELLNGVPERKHRRCVAVDETKMKRNGKQIYVWSAIDVDSYELLAIRASRTRSSMDAYVILRRVPKSCVKKPLILVDNGWTVVSLGIRAFRIEMGARNLWKEEQDREVV